MAEALDHPELLNESEKSAELRDILHAIAKDDPLEYMDIIADTAKKLKNTHGDLTDYRLYHLLIGSTPGDKCKSFDLPNGEIETAIRNLGGQRS